MGHRLKQRGGGGENGFSLAALDHPRAADGHAKVVFVQRKSVGGIALGLRPSCMEVRASDAVYNGSADTALGTGRVFNTRVIFRTASVPHFVTRVYHAKRGIEGIGIEG